METKWYFSGSVKTLEDPKLYARKWVGQLGSRLLEARLLGSL